MINPRHRLFTPEEYLLLEEKSDQRSEYCDGEIFAMSGGSVNHNQITFNVAKSFDWFLSSKPCRVFSTDVRLRVQKSGLYTYPDVTVICGKIEFVPGRDDTVLNPIVLVEVWSDSTKEYDRGAKFAMYRHIPSLKEYVMIDQTKPYIEHFHRDGNFWVLETLEQMDAILNLPSLEIQIPLMTIYEKVEWQGEKSDSFG
ncbi:MAG: Uma2 family endonuclease [Chloroflexi bacterium]|nr:Uma2 family endonuclease [Chloroflexota bacterium]